MYFTWTAPTGKNIVFTPPVFELTDQWDLGVPEVEHQTDRAPYQDGTTLIDSIYQPRHIYLEYLLRAENRQRLFDLQAEIIELFNVKNGKGFLKWTQVRPTYNTPIVYRSNIPPPIQPHFYPDIWSPDYRSYVPQFYSNIMSGTAPLTVQFVMQSDGYARWDFGDGTIGDPYPNPPPGFYNVQVTNPVHTYTKPGVYSVKLTALPAPNAAYNVTYQNYITVTEVEDPMNTGKEYIIYCIADGAPVFPKGEARGELWQVAQIPLIAHDPYFYKIPKKRATFAPIIKNFFPFQFPFSLGQNMSQQSVINTGNALSPVTIAIIGKVTNPIMTKTSSYMVNNQILTKTESLSLTIVMGLGDRFVITTGFGNKTATYYPYGGTPTNGFPYLDSASIFWQLYPGTNVLEFGSASVDASTTTTVEWYDKFIGV